MEKGINTRKIILPVMILMALLIMVLPAFVLSFDTGSDEITSDYSGSFDIDEEHIGHPNDFEHWEEQKEIPMEINDVEIFGHHKGTAYPNIPFYIRISYTAVSPDKITVLMDLDDPDTRIEYSIRTDTFIITEKIENIILLNVNDSRTIFNSTKGKWETDIHMRFKWTVEEDRSFGIGVFLDSVNGQSSYIEIKDAYTVENDLEVKGEPKIIVEDSVYLTPDGYLRGGTFLKMTDISVTFSGTDTIYPQPSDIRMGIVDSKGMIWSYEPAFRSDLANIHFSFRVPMLDGPDRFIFKILETPSLCEVKGNGTVELILDSTPAVIGDIKGQLNEGSVAFDMEARDEGSGIDLSTFTARIKERNGEIIRDWYFPTNLVIDGSRIGFHVDALPLGDFILEVNLKDRVSNYRDEPKRLFFSTLPAERHDISLDPKIEVSMSPIIEGGTIHFSATLRNSGTIDEEGMLVDIIKDGNLFKRVEMETLLSGTSRKLTWTWTAERDISVFTVILDPLGLIDDLYPDDNIATIEVRSEYRDLAMRTDYLLPSKWDANEGDVISLSMIVVNTGSISTDQFKVLVREGSTFLGQYVIYSMEADSSREINIDWIVDKDLEFFDVSVDPFNEITESVEDNNKVQLRNPLFDPTDTPMKEDTSGEGSGASSIQDNDVDEVDEKNEGTKGGTVWKGPEEEDDEVVPAIPVPSSLSDDPPSMSQNDPEMIPFLIPSIVVSFILMSLAGSMVLLRFEPARYSWTLMFIPLYSKLKKSKIEKGVRFEILGYIKARPGANYSELKRNLDLNDGSLVHHLRVLEREEKIYSKKMGKYKLFYASSYKRSPSIEEYISPFHQRILQLISENPGIVPKKLSLMLDRSQTDISYHLSELSRTGYLEKIKKGRNIHYYINKEILISLLT